MHNLLAEALKSLLIPGYYRDLAAFARNIEKADEAGPFVEGELEAHAADGLAWDLRQAARKALTQLQSGDTAAARRQLQVLHGRLPEGAARISIADLIENLQGAVEGE